MHNVFVAATDRVQAVVEGRCAPVVTHEDGDQSRVPPGSMEWEVLVYQQTVMLDHDPLAPYMSQMMKVTYCGDYATVCQLVAGKTEEQVRQLLNTRESLKRRGALHHAVVGALALCGDDPNTERYRQEVAAVMPVKNDHIKIVLKLISLGAEVNMPDFTGETPLHLCLCATAEFPIDSSIKIAKALLRAGADANQQDRFGHTPLLAATICQKFSLMSLLLQHGADPFIAANNGVSPFSVSSSRPRALQIFSKFSKAACKEARAGQKEAAGGNLWAIPQYPGHLRREILIFSQKSLRTIHTYHLVPFKLPKNVQRCPFQGLLVFKNFFQKISYFTKYVLTPTY